MKTYLIGAATGTLLLGGASMALADVIITPEQETVIREYVEREPLASINLPGVELSIGSRLPETVELHEVPDVEYHYVVIDEQTVVVEPGTRRIVKVIR